MLSVKKRQHINSALQMNYGVNPSCGSMTANKEAGDRLP